MLGCIEVAIVNLHHMHHLYDHPTILGSEISCSYIDQLLGHQMLSELGTCRSEHTVISYLEECLLHHLNVSFSSIPAMSLNANAIGRLLISSP